MIPNFESATPEKIKKLARYLAEMPYWEEIVAGANAQEEKYGHVFKDGMSHSELIDAMIEEDYRQARRKNPELYAAVDRANLRLREEEENRRRREKEENSKGEKNGE